MKRLSAAPSGGSDPRIFGRWSAWLPIVGMCLGLAACGGGGGGGASGSANADATAAAPALLGIVKVTVVDSFGAAVPGAAVVGPRGTTNTDAQGQTLVFLDTPDGTASVTVSHATFADKSIVATSARSQVNAVTVTIDRLTSAAGGSLSSRSGFLPTVSNTAEQMTFEIELVVVDGDSRPIENLTMANFALRACTPDPANARADCLRGSGADPDVAYTPATSTPEASQLVAGLPARPYAAGLLLDQSGSIRESDPTGARLFSTKAFLSGLGADDHALLAAFAGAPGALIPTAPMTVYAPFRGRAGAASYFPTLDSLVPLVGGNTPLYQSLDALRQQIVSNTSLPAAIPKAVVIFTDGTDTNCASADACRTARAESIRLAQQDQVRIFTIGLSSGVDIAALGELANQTGGAVLYADTAQQLLPLYGSVGKLLSLSLPTYRLRWTVQASAPGVFRSGNTLLGRVQVTAGGNTFDVPLVVGIP